MHYSNSNMDTLANGYITQNPIEIHNDLMRRPFLIYRCEHDLHSDTVHKLGYIPIYALPIQSTLYETRRRCVVINYMKQDGDVWL